MSKQISESFPRRDVSKMAEQEVSVLVPTQKHHLTRLHGLKYLYKNARMQSRASRTPTEQKARTASPK